MKHTATRFRPLEGRNSQLSLASCTLCSTVSSTRMPGASVNVFELDQSLIRDYERFARSFTQLRAPDIRVQVEAIYASDRFWPEPLVSINPRFERGPSIDQLAGSGTLHAGTAQVFSGMANRFPSIGIRVRL